MKKILWTATLFTLMLMLLVAIFAAGCAEQKQNDQNGVNNNQNNGDTESKEKGTENIVFKAGETAEIGDVVFALNGIRYEEGDESWAPEEDQKWIVFDCTVENKSSETIFVTTITPANTFQLYDTEGYSKETTVIATSKGNLNTEIAPGRKVSGEVAYVINEEETDWEFVFNPGLDTGQAVYEINVSDIN